MLLNHPKLRCHFDPAAPGFRTRALLVNGSFRGGRVAHHHTPATSYALASLVNVWQQTVHAGGSIYTGGYAHRIVLSFFCGPHNRTRRKAHGAEAILAHWIAQLIDQGDEILQTDYRGNINKWRGRIDEAEFAELQVQFEQLLNGLPPHCVVLCIVDSLDWLMTTGAAGKQDGRSVVAFLCRLASDGHAPRFFRPLITTARSSAGFRDLFGRDEIIDLGDAGKALRSSAASVDDRWVRRSVMKLWASNP